MDGDVAFNVNEPHLLTAGISVRGATADLLGAEPDMTFGAVQSGLEQFNPIAALLRRWVMACAVIVGTFAAGWLGHLFLSPPEMLEEVTPEIIAVLVFFLVIRLR